MPKLDKSRRRETQRANEPPRHRKMSGPALKAARQRRTALKRKYGWA